MRFTAIAVLLGAISAQDLFLQNDLRQLEEAAPVVAGGDVSKEDKRAAMKAKWAAKQAAAGDAAEGDAAPAKRGGKGGKKGGRGGKGKGQGPTDD